jgi:hypothetical protein
MIAKLKLQKLKELQRRRDAVEKYYSYEIERLIDDEQMNMKIPKMTSHSQYKKIFSQKYTEDCIPSNVQDVSVACSMYNLNNYIKIFFPVVMYLNKIFA